MKNDYSLENLRPIKIIRYSKLQISRTPFLEKHYFDLRYLKLHRLVAARKGEEMLEPYELETLTYSSYTRERE
ncbi:hypothetical protein [Paraclostridium bifermentans]|uniref:hypothetical protein n=1 Tax=Paraclostridium bifermentans TaxID=1490 RepID=UPI003D2DA06B